MGQQTVYDGDVGLSARNKINQNFTELYASGILPIKITGVTGTVNQVLPANCMVTMITIRPTSGAPTIRIGTSPGGKQVLDDMQISALQLIQYQQFFATSATLYFTYMSGTGILNIRIDLLQNYI